MQDYEKKEKVAKNSRMLVERYLQQHSFVESNILSFNDFIENRLQDIVNSINEEISREEIDLWLGKASIGKPVIIEADGSTNKIMPIEAKLRKLTYSAPVHLEVAVGNKEFTSIEIGRIPIMVKSKCCNTSGMPKKDLIENYEDPADPGGYFIINGNARVLVMIEDLAQNQPFVENTLKGRSLRLFSARGSYRIPLLINQTNDGLLTVSFSRFRNIPAVMLIKALGVTKDVEINSFIGKESDSVIVNLYEHVNLKDSNEALLAIAEKMGMFDNKKEMLDRVKIRLDSALLPHLGTKPENRKEKSIILCKLIKHFLIAKEKGLESDKDHYSNKRVRLSGDLLSDLLRVNLTILVRDLQHNLQKVLKKKKLYSLKSLARSTLFSHRVESAIATGSWIGQRTGVTQNIDKTNSLAVLSQLQRVVSLLPSEQENFKARTLHPTHFGRFCPIETPEGTPIGLRKNLAMLAKISTAVKINDKDFISSLEAIGLKIPKS